MQAQQLSSPAARKPFLAGVPAPSTVALPSLAPPSIAEGPGLAHDAGNLLGALGLYCDLLDAPGVLRPEHLHYARELRLLSQRSSALISRLLHDSTGGNEAARLRCVCPAETLRAIAPLLKSLAAPDADVLIDTPHTLPSLPFAVESFERVLVNLTRNAATALRSHQGGDEARQGEIRISLRVKETESGPARLCLVIADNGPGMPPTAAAAFMKPAPLPRGVRRGLGHRIVHELLASTGGELTIKVAVRRGTTLRIEWPLPADSHSARDEEHRAAC